MIFRPSKSVFLAALLLLSLFNLGLCEDPEKVKTKSSNIEKIEQLIEQLGSLDYKEREQAEQDLLKLNIEAFFPLFKAKNHRDPEIAARAKYLVRTIQANLVMPDDSERVMGLMQDIFKLDFNKQSIRIKQLSGLPHGEGLDALCRLILFSESEISAHMAALGIMEARLHDKENPLPMSVPKEKIVREIHRGQGLRIVQNKYDMPSLVEKSSNKKISGKPLGPKEREKIRRHLNSCDRPAAKLALLYLDFDEAKTDVEKKSLYDQWHKICEQQDQESQKYGVSAMTGILISLLEIQLEKAHQIKLPDDTQADLVQRLLAKQPFWRQNKYPQMIHRLIDEKIWKLADMSIPEFYKIMPEVYKNNFLPRFFCLLIHSGKTKAGNELLELHANRLTFRGINKAKDCIKTADILIEEGLLDLAIKQYKAAIEAESVNQHNLPEHMACWDAFTKIMDIQEELGQIEKAGKTAEQMLAMLKKTPDRFKNRTVTKTLIDEAQSLSAYYQAMIEKKKGNETEYRKLLEKAINLDSKAVKVLVECYRLPATTPQSKKFHERIVQQIEKTAKSLMCHANTRRQVSSRSYKNDLVVNAYSAAWLVVNTEGSLHLVITCLERAIDINDKSTDFKTFNILAQCYHKKGNIEKAISFARKAMEKAPYDKQNQKTWTQLSSEYEKKIGKKPEPPKSGTERFRMLVGLESE